MTDIRSTPALALHGGAGSNPGRDYRVELAHMRGLIEQGRDELNAGRPALDVVVDITAALEASGLYIAGRGASPNLAGKHELDACVMDGWSGRAGAVAALQGFPAPVLIARQIMETTPHVILAGEGAAQFAMLQGFEPIADPEAWFTPAGLDEDNYLEPARAHGTVGCVARDVDGLLAAATSTGGVFGKLPGRCGDTPIVGAGCWADRHAAVSCTGQGEYFIRVAAAAQVAHRIRFLGEALQPAAESVIAEVAILGGSGGLIAIDAEGRVAMPFRAIGMKRAALRPDGSVYAAAF